MVQHILIGLVIGIIIGALLGFYLTVRTSIQSTHFYEKLYTERQHAFAIAAEANAAFNSVKGRSGKHAQNRRIIMPGDYDAQVGASINPRADQNAEQQTG